MFKIVIISSIIFVTSFSVWAAPQTYKVTAKVGNVSEYTTGALPAPLNVGDEVTMTYVLDDAKSPDYPASWGVHYMFNQNEASMQVSWSNVTLKTSAFQSITYLSIVIDANNGNGVQNYMVASAAPFENNGNPATDLQFIGINLHSDGPQYQAYTPWGTPDLNKFTMKNLDIFANGFQINANVTSIVNARDLDGPFAVWPGHGNMHISQQFDVFVTAPEGYNFIEFVTDPMVPPLPIPCEIAPNFNAQTEIKFLCRNLDAARLQLYFTNNNGVTIRLKNLSTGQSLERVMYWRMVD